MLHPGRSGSSGVPRAEGCSPLDGARENGAARACPRMALHMISRRADVDRAGITVCSVCPFLLHLAIPSLSSRSSLLRARIRPSSRPAAVRCRAPSIEMTTAGSICETIRLDVQTFGSNQHHTHVDAPLPDQELCGYRRAGGHADPVRVAAGPPFHACRSGWSVRHPTGVADARVCGPG